ncbi:hypothetical protein CERZMDRAFT_81169 [Cercospora zeae-maydis SCOH1-5]|uniref:Uncharacterized protein n=1 Tax=Cercospora zeae-maydis SCOH1-5 TaxID=717836 RepID=A0A6A6FUX3_9PEZI|nr:hypothetical protein CERZMDRAFT_81169 [Cercospora zeae-maydis SCOH1-5]
MSSWAKEIIGRLFPTKGRNRAASDTTATKDKQHTAGHGERQRSRRRSSLSTATALFADESRSKANTTTASASTHRRIHSQPAPKIARLCHVRSQTQVNPTAKLPDHVMLPYRQQDEQDEEVETSDIDEVRHATRDALRQTEEPLLPVHDRTIEWEPPVWEDLWKDSSRSIRSHSNTHLSAILRTPRAAVKHDGSKNTSSSKRDRSVSRKSSFENLRSSVRPHRESFSSGAGGIMRVPNIPTRHQHTTRAGLDKKLPGLPSHTSPAHLPTSGLEENAARNARIIKSLQDDGILNLKDSEETHTAVIWQPAVTHEKHVVQPVEIVQRAVSRDVHNHHHVHRVLPVLDLEVLPARHFVPDGRGGYLEITEEEIPGGKPAGLEHLISEAVSRSSPTRRDESGSGGPAAMTQMHRPWLHAHAVGTSTTQSKRSPEKHEASPKNRNAMPSRIATSDAQHTASPERVESHEIPGSRTRHQAFQYLTPNGLPSWTAINSSAESQSKPPAAAPAPRQNVAAASGSENGKRDASLLPREPIHTTLPVHVAHGGSDVAPP